MRRLRTLVKMLRSAQRGQATIEYVLMLGSILVIISAFLTAFHTDIVRWFFSFVGLLLEK